jgi:cobalt-zinc-cadmium efflux system outer membrane protein
LGGKRAKRVTAAKQGKQLALWDYETARADVAASVGKAFVEVLTAQQRLALRDELLDVAEEVARTFRLRVEAGQVSPLQESKANVALANARIARQTAGRDLNAARSALAALWGDASPVFGEAVGELEEAPPLPDLSDLAKRIEANPDIARWATELSAREADLALARAQRIPDLTVEAGFKSTGIASGASEGFGLDSDGGFGLSRSESEFDADRDNSLVLGFSLPLPLFDRNQGGIAKAQHMISKASDRRRAADVSVLASLTQSHEKASAARDEIMTLQKDVLPQATDIYAKTQRGYGQGKLEYLDVLDAQRTLFEARTSYLDALARFHKAVVDIERLTGASMAAVRGSEENNNETQ